MNFKKVFKMLITEFQKNKLDFALIGGQAMFFMKVVRATFDIDFLANLNDADKIDKIMKTNAYDIVHKTIDIANYSSKDTTLGQVDFLFAHRKYAIKMLENAVEKNIFDYKIKVIRAEDMIGLKVQSIANDVKRQHQDIADIEKILEKNYNELDLEKIREYFVLFDMEEEFKKIIKGFNKDNETDG